MIKMSGVIDLKFLYACRDAGIEPTLRQYSKWQKKKGMAWTSRQKMETAAIKELKEARESVKQ